MSLGRAVSGGDREHDERNCERAGVGIEGVEVVGLELGVGCLLYCEND